MPTKESIIFLIDIYLISVPVSLLLFLVTVKIYDGFVVVKDVIECLFYSLIPVAGFVVSCMGFGTSMMLLANKSKILNKKVF